MLFHLAEFCDVREINYGRLEWSDIAKVGLKWSDIAKVGLEWSNIAKVGLERSDIAKVRIVFVGSSCLKVG